MMQLNRTASAAHVEGSELDGSTLGTQWPIFAQTLPR